MVPTRWRQPRHSHRFGPGAPRSRQRENWLRHHRLQQNKGRRGRHLRTRTGRRRLLHRRGRLPLHKGYPAHGPTRRRPRNRLLGNRQRMSPRRPKIRLHLPRRRLRRPNQPIPHRRPDGKGHHPPRHRSSPRPKILAHAA